MMLGTPIRDYDDLIAALRAAKESLQVTDAEFEAKVGMTSGHLSKIIGAAPAKSLGPVSLEKILAGCGVVLIVSPDPEPVAMDFERRARPAQKNRVTKAAIERAKPILAPIIVKELAAAGGRARAAKLDHASRHASAKKAARARWKRDKSPRTKRRLLSRARERRAQRQQPSAADVQEEST